jgi:hypothetical protein
MRVLEKGHALQPLDPLGECSGGSRTPWSPAPPLNGLEMNRCAVDRLVVTDVVPHEIIPSAEI